MMSAKNEGDWLEPISLSAPEWQMRKPKYVLLLETELQLSTGSSSSIDTGICMLGRGATENESIEVWHNVGDVKVRLYESTIAYRFIMNTMYPRGES
jgi:hypothetical protein